MDKITQQLTDGPGEENLYFEFHTSFEGGEPLHHCKLILDADYCSATIQVAHVSPENLRMLADKMESAAKLTNV